MSDTLLRKTLKKFYSDDCTSRARVSRQKKRKASSAVETYIAASENLVDKKGKNLEALLKLSSKKLNKTYAEKVIKNFQPPKEDKSESLPKEEKVFSDADFEIFESEYFVQKI
ncbi:active regulator of SIRT1-like isoform X2 [Artemia franciscana]|uniref:active regulator of SIRT1-like isoform X2 n=1 Tax=Artemia franciscana TaxID=6661 RepID=UPI0032DB788E